MQRMFYFLSFGMIAALVSASQVQSQPRTCVDRMEMIDRLETHFGESRQSSVQGPDDAIVEIYAAQETGSWTITITADDGLACLVAAGQAFQYLDIPLAFLINGT